MAVTLLQDCTLLLSISCLIYFNSLRGGFVFDDHRAILSNDDLDPEKTSLHEVLVHDFWGGHMNREQSHKSYRPMTILSYRYINFIHHKLDPYGYHVVNVLFHAFACVLFYWFCRLYVRERIWCLFAALLFAVHSVHTEVVANIVGRAESLSCIFFLLTILSYTQVIKPTVSMYSSEVKWPLVLLTIFFAASSMLSKEQGIASLAVCGAIDVLIHWDSVVLRCTEKFRKHFIKNGKGIPVDICLCQQTKKTFKACDLKFMILRIILLALCGGILLEFRLSMNYGTEPIFKPNELKAAFHENRLIRILSFSKIYAINSWLLLAPSQLCCDWSLESVTLVENIFDISNVWSGILYVGVLSLTFRAVTCTRINKTPVGIGLALLLIPFLPASGLLLRVGFVVAERVLYTPSLGYCLLISLGFRKLWLYFQGWKLVRWGIALSMMYILVIMSIKTHNRNLDWLTDLSLYKSAVEVLPNNVKMQNNYAMELKREGRIEEARKVYQHAMQMDADFGELYFNYGNLLSDEGDFQGALQQFERAATYEQMYTKTLNNLATMYFRLGRNQDAENCFLESIRLTPDQSNVYSNLGSLYGMTNRPKQAEQMFKKAIEINPTYTEGLFNLGTLLVQHHRPIEGEVYLRKVLQLNPHHTGAANNLKVALYEKSSQASKKTKETVKKAKSTKRRKSKQ